MRPVKAIVDVAGLELTQEDAEFLAHPAVGGVILFTRNYETREQLHALTQSIKRIDPTLLVTVDQEGGRVQRFRDGFSALLPMSSFGTRYLAEPQQAILALREQLTTMIDELQSVGVDATLLPVLDINYERSDIIGERSLGRDPTVVTALARIIIQTLHDVGMPVTLKHFPGHGFVEADSHHELPIDTRSYAELIAEDMLPFQQLLPQADFVMPAHIVFPKVDHRPVGFSPVWIQDILRKQLGYKGNIITDDLSMAGAAAYGDYQARAEAAIDAGCDFLLVCNNRSGAIDVVTALEYAKS